MIVNSGSRGAQVSCGGSTGFLCKGLELKAPADDYDAARAPLTFDCASCTNCCDGAAVSGSTSGSCTGEDATLSVGASVLCTRGSTKFPTTKEPTRFPTREATKFPVRRTRFPTQFPSKFPIVVPSAYPSPSKYPTAAMTDEECARAAEQCDSRRLLLAVDDEATNALKDLVTALEEKVTELEDEIKVLKKNARPAVHVRRGSRN